MVGQTYRELSAVPLPFPARLFADSQPARYELRLSVRERAVMIKLHEDLHP